jgi:hypothetical protein
MKEFLTLFCSLMCVLVNHIVAKLTVTINSADTYITSGGPKGRDFHGLGGLGAFPTHSSMASINYTTHLSEPRSCGKSALHVDCINYTPAPSAIAQASVEAEVDVEAGVGAPMQYTACRDVDRSVSGVEFLIAACKAHPGEVSILILSPVTTLATAVSAFPSLPNYVKR